MSGGCFDYLYLKSLNEHRTNLLKTAKWLEKHGHLDASLETMQVVALLDRADKLRFSLHEVWRGVEWSESGDSNPESVAVKVDAWRREHRALSTHACTRAPEGWQCSRERGHDGPCSAHAVPR